MIVSMNTLPVLTEAGVDPAVFADESLMQALQGAASENIANDLFDELFRRYEVRVRAWCLRLTGDREHSGDLSQEIFFKAYRHRHSFRGASRFSTWLYAIARNHCLNSIRQRAAEPVPCDDGICHAIADATALEPYNTIERNQSYRLVWELVSAALTPLETHVLKLHYGHDVPLAEITAHLALSNPSGAKAYIVSARRKLSGSLRQRAMQLAG
jgi:RNA polymerase sigma-70 factor, ECF subfamily